MFLAVLPTTTGTTITHFTTSKMNNQRIKVIVGCVGAFIGVIAAVIIFLLIWKRKELKHQGLPIILQESNSPGEERDSAPPLPAKLQNGHLSAATQRDSLIPLIRKRNSSYRSQLSSSASGGTIMTFADGMLSFELHQDLQGINSNKFCKTFLRIISERKKKNSVLIFKNNFPPINSKKTIHSKQGN